jgi:ribokinase
LELQKKIVDVLPQESPPKIIFSPGALYSKRGYDALAVLIENSYLCLLNKNEIKKLTGEDYVKGSELLISKGVEIVAVTLGKEGCYITSGQDQLHEHVPPSDEGQVIDTTGAGDAFAAGFIFGILNDMPLEKSGKLGNNVAFKCIQHMGARTGLPTVGEIEKLL